jgi:hypothetical protein
VEDDSVHILLAQSLVHWNYTLEPNGDAVTDPLPGFPALIALPVAIAGKSLDLLRFLSIPLMALILWLTWKLALCYLDAPIATCVVLMTTINPFIIERLGLILPDLPFLALSLFLFLVLPKVQSTRGILLLALGTALASLLKPYGALLIFSLTLALWIDSGILQAIGFFVLALSPLSLWLFRDYLVGRTITGYASHWRSQVSLLGDLRSWYGHAIMVMTNIFGQGFLGLSLKPWILIPIAACIVWVTALSGTLDALSRKKDARLFAIAVYLFSLLCLHLTWISSAARYEISFLPFLWILFSLGVCAILQKTVFRISIFILLALLSMPMSASILTERWRNGGDFKPQTMAYIRKHTPPSAKFEAVEWPTLFLFSHRRVAQIILAMANRDAWLADAVQRRINYLLIDQDIHGDGYMPSHIIYNMAHLEEWAHSTSYARKVYENKSENTVIYKIDIPHPKKFMKAYSSYQIAALAFTRHVKIAFVRKELREAVRIEPNLADAWAFLGTIEKSPKKSVFDFERALRAYPNSKSIKTELAKLKKRPTRPPPPRKI